MLLKSFCLKYAENDEKVKHLFIKNLRSAVSVPFLVVNTSRETEIDCSISEDQFEYHLKFNREFELQDEWEILKRLGLADATNAENLLPPKLRHFLRLGNYGSGNTDQSNGSNNMPGSNTLAASNSLTGSNSLAGSSNLTGSNLTTSNNSDSQIELIELSDPAKDIKVETNVSRSLFSE